MKTIKPKFTLKKKTDNKTLAAYLLLAFFVFVFIGSVLGIIAFARTSKDRQAFNVVGASANVVNDFYKQESVNLSDYTIRSFPLDFPFGSISTVKEYSSDRGYYYRLNTYIDEQAAVAEPTDLTNMQWFMQDYREYIDKQLFISFTVDASIAYYLTFYMVGVEGGQDRDYQYFEYEDDELGRDVIYTNFFFLDGHYDEVYFGCFVSSDYVLDTNFYIDNFSIKPYISYTGYSYTYNEFYELLAAEKEQAYKEGASTTEGYKIGFEAGKQEVVNTLNGFFDISQWEFYFAGGSSSANSFTLRDFRPTMITRNTIELERSIYNAFDVNNLSYLDYAQYSCRLLTTNVQNLALDAISFNINLVKPNPNWDEPSDVDYAITPHFVDTNNTVYEPIYSQISDTSYVATYDFSTMLPNASLKYFAMGMNIGRVAGYGITITSFGEVFSNAYDTGFTDGYNQGVNSYQTELDRSYDKGFKAGEVNGYNTGYNEGAEDAGNYTFTSLIGSVVDVPIKAFTGLFNFEILGINLANFFFALLTMCIVLALIKFII